MVAWLKTLLFFSLPATAVSALGLYHQVSGGATKVDEKCCKQCPEECKKGGCCQREGVCLSGCNNKCCKKVK